MPNVKIPLPLTKGRLWNLAQDFSHGHGYDPLYFAVEEGELIVSTEPLGDDPSVAPLTEGAYTP